MPPTLSVFIRAIRHECDGVASFELEPCSGAVLPAHSPGAHVDVQMPSGVVRSYSLLEPVPGSSNYRIAVKREPASRGGSLWLHEGAHVGQPLRITEPANHFALVEDAPASVFIAGGIGITPLLAMVARLDGLARPWALHYAAATRAGMPFRELLQRMAGTGPGELHLHISEDGGPRMDVARIVAEAPAGAHLYCCGPAGMIDTFLDAAQHRPPQEVHHERFAASQAAATGGELTLKLSRDGRVLAVPEGKTVLDTLLDAGLDVPYSCTQGVCGSCRIAVLDGIPDHRDAFLTDEEKAANDCMLVCCSGGRTPQLTLDL